MQENLAVTGNAITGTLNNLTSGALVDAWGEGHFMGLKFSTIDPAATSVMVGMEPSYGHGLVEILNDPDKDGAWKVTDKDEQKFVVETTTPAGKQTQKFDLTGLIFE